MEKKTNRQIFGENFRRWLSVRGISRSEIAARAGVSYSAISEWYHGRKYPRVDMIEKIAQILDIPKTALTEAGENLSAAAKYDRLTESQKKIIDQMLNEFLGK